MSNIIDAIEKDYMKCIILKENFIPTAFLVYTTSISESIELNLIHCLGTEDVVTKYKLLVEKFMQLTEGERHSKVVSYPMIGHQSIFTADIAKYGFKLSISVKYFISLFNNTICSSCTYENKIWTNWNN